jgi:PAS domain S-box-containing protein
LAFSEGKPVKKQSSALIRKTAHDVKSALEYAQTIVSTVREPLVVLDAELRIISANDAFYRFFSLKPEMTEGQLIFDIGNRQWDIPELRQLLEEILPKNTSFESFEMDHDFPGLGRCVMILNARRMHDDGDQTQRILLAMEDITGRKRLEHEMVSSELRYRRLFETAQDGILILDAEKRRNHRR